MVHIPVDVASWYSVLSDKCMWRDVSTFWAVECSGLQLYKVCSVLCMRRRVQWEEHTDCVTCTAWCSGTCRLYKECRVNIVCMGSIQIKEECSLTSQWHHNLFSHKLTQVNYLDEHTLGLYNDCMQQMWQYKCNACMPMHGCFVWWYK